MKSQFYVVITWGSELWQVPSYKTRHYYWPAVYSDMVYHVKLPKGGHWHRYSTCWLGWTLQNLLCVIISLKKSTLFSQKYDIYPKIHLHDNFLTKYPFGDQLCEIYPVRDNIGWDNILFGTIFLEKHTLWTLECDIFLWWCAPPRSKGPSFLVKYYFICHFYTIYLII